MRIDQNRRKLFLFLLCIFFIVAVFRTYADRGMIPFNPTVKIFEPNQKAMIAWDGNEEILLLSTDISSSQPTKVLEAMPFPSEPEVKKGQLYTFEVAVNLINKKLSKKKEKKKEKGLRSKGAGDAAIAAPAGKVTFHKQIGAHDISVTQVLSSEGFIKWVNEYLKSQGVDNPSIPEPMKKVITSYLKGGFEWFVFDVVEVGDDIRTHDAIMYRFKSKFLYYPLKVMKTLKGKTSIQVIILTPKLLKNFKGISADKVKVKHKPFTVTLNDFYDARHVDYGMFEGLFDGANSEKSMKDIEEMFDMLGVEKVKLRIWQIKGKASAFKKDLLVK